MMDDATKAKVTALGTHMVEEITDWCEREKIDDINIVLNLLCSVLAHYMGGIDDRELRVGVYAAFGMMLMEHIEASRELGCVAAVVKRGPLQ